TKLLDGSFANATFQVGANAGEGIAIDSIVSAKSNTLGTTTVSSSDVIAVDVETDNATDGVALAAGDLTITDASGTAVDLGPIGAATTNEQRTSQIVDAINAKSSDTDIFAKIEYDATGAVTGYSVFSSSRTLDGSEFGGSFAADPTGDVGGATYADADFALEDIDINSFGAAQLAMKVIDTSIDSINSSRADLGALQSRFENAVANINITSENISAARGRIVDADFAKETSNLSRA
ncbi:flagellin, partial [Hydrogenophaga borbori]